ncbi:MAG: flagellar basal-body rod protein FlgB [Rhodospirillales bacterium RIFCSPLOWO2_01_FULL_65_14]|nr:MAG: flagellar basal-body rod protein FlgB [Rhodospirillales bacterium RIFCSPLOWO2_01_FULL_65_14]
MEFGKIPLFDLVKSRLGWLGHRQDVVSQNIANADTPKYRARDVQPFKFEDVLRRSTRQPVNMQVTQVNHLPGIRQRPDAFKETVERNPYETSPDGNSVVLEEQIGKMNEIDINHRLITELYKKHLNMIKTAIGKGR